ncbi:hypothetical protein FPOAC2_10767 [Fusarium poae]
MASQTLNGETVSASGFVRTVVDGRMPQGMANRFARFDASSYPVLLPMWLFASGSPVKIKIPCVTIKGAANEFLANICQPEKDKSAKTAYV